MLARHMNAVKVKERQLLKLNPSEWIMEEKWKGIRVFYNKWPDGQRQLITRGGEDITDNFPHLVQFDWVPQLNAVQLDCELYDPAQEDEVVSGWAFRTTVEPDHVEGCILKIFDILHIANEPLHNYPQIERKQILSQLKLRQPFEVVPYFPAEKHREYYEHITTSRNKYGKLGEGIMLKNKQATYAEGVRQVGRWLKRKKRDPFDCIVLGFTEAKEGKFYGLIGAVTVGQYINGQLRPICNVSGMSDDVRRDMTLNPQQYIGRACSIFAMEQHPVTLSLIEPSWKGLRIDKLPEECIYQREDLQEREEDRMIEL